MQAGAVGGRIGHRIGLGLGEFAVQPARGDLGVEGLLLRLALLVALGGGLPSVAELLHRFAHRRRARILHRVAGIEPALAYKKRDDVDHWLFPARRF
ncbi:MULTISPECIES: hypothetical protein [unclassified Mesorhizobium]|uniref:hypothetical protein n=1 Tax=unclassified Mesorhizobium TaxID=325217 RepID=UPI0019CFD31D|nr:MULTISPECIES: hypothetical protein [unclassified Mesorhizobium]